MTLMDAHSNSISVKDPRNTSSENDKPMKYYAAKLVLGVVLWVVFQCSVFPDYYLSSIPF